MEYDHQCVCGHREKDHDQGRVCSVCDCGSYTATNIVKLEKSDS